MTSASIEALPGGVRLHVSRAHRFGADALLLADFAGIRGGERVCDLCSGCGIVAARWFASPHTAPREAWCVELMPDAAALIEATAQDNGLAGRLLPLCGDLRRLPPQLEPGSFDVVSCNPPYSRGGAGIPSAGEADRAARHEETCTLEDVCAAAGRLLRYGGRLCLCHRPARLPDVFEAMRGARIEPKALRLVHTRLSGAPFLALIEGRLGGGRELRVIPPLETVGADGEPSAEMARICGRKEGG